MQKTGRSDLPYPRGHLAFTSESRYVEFCGGKKNDYKSARRDLNQDQKDQRERESWRQPLIFTRLEKHVGRAAIWTTATFVKSRSEQNTRGIFSAGVEREVLQSRARERARLRRPRCYACGARDSARMVALRKGGRDRVCGQGERQLNLGLV